MKGEITTLVISSINRLTGSTAENAKYGVNWETLLEKGEYKMYWNYMESETDTSVPNAPTNLIATTTGSTTASIAFTPPAGTILDYTMISSPATTAIVGLSSPIAFTGLTPNTAYTFTMTARNEFGNSVASAPSNSITTTETSGFTSFGFLTLTDPNYGGAGSSGGQSIATSSNGVYIAICANNAIHNSSNSGASFVLTTIVKGFHTVEMNSTGQYQVALSTGIPASNIYVSTDYGVSWIDRKLLTTNNAGRWGESIAITTTGQYMFMGGGGGAGLQAQFSIDFGATWTQKGSISNRRGSTVNNTTTRALCTETFGNNINQLTLNAPPNNESVLVGALNFASRITSDGGNNIVYNNNGTQVAVSTDDAVSFTLKTSPQTTFIFMRGARLWGHDASTVVYSDNLGTTWTTLLTGLSIRTMTPVVGNAKIYLVYTTGEVLKYVL